MTDRENKWAIRILVILAVIGVIFLAVVLSIPSGDGEGIPQPNTYSVSLAGADSSKAVTLVCYEDAQEVSHENKKMLLNQLLERYPELKNETEAAVKNLVFTPVEKN